MATGLLVKPTIIENRKTSFFPDLAELYRFKDLLFLLVQRELVTRFRQTVLGRLWFILQPLGQTVVFTAVFWFVARVPTEGVPPVLFYLSGLLIWSYFANTFNDISFFLTRHADIFSKAYFPRLVIPCSIVISNAVMFLGQLSVFFLLYAVYAASGKISGSFWTNPRLVFLPLQMIQAGGFALGFGLVVASLGIRYRDIQQSIGTLIQAMMYATPIIYPWSLVPRPLKFVLALNPMVPVVESYRNVFFGTQPISFYVHFISGVSSFGMLMLGLWMFHRVERDFIDTV